MLKYGANVFYAQRENWIFSVKSFTVHMSTFERKGIEKVLITWEEIQLPTGYMLYGENLVENVTWNWGFARFVWSSKKSYVKLRSRQATGFKTRNWWKILREIEVVPVFFDEQKNLREIVAR